MHERVLSATGTVPGGAGGRCGARSLAGAAASLFQVQPVRVDGAARLPRRPDDAHQQLRHPQQLLVQLRLRHAAGIGHPAKVRPLPPRARAVSPVDRALLTEAGEGGGAGGPRGAAGARRPPLTAAACCRFSPYEWQNPHPCDDQPETLENVLNPPNAFWFAIGSLMQQGSDIAPK